MKIVLVGAGGSGISNLAYILDELGYTNLLAIDGYESQITQALRDKGIPLIIGHGKYELQPDDILIYSEAVVESPEVQTAFRLKLEHQQPLKIWNYFQFLGEMSKYFRTVGFS
ncbi:MAG: Mur ligase domain-containing protein [bacterium]|nr:Mur ligase domain-containing protein [bacterium]